MMTLRSRQRLTGRVIFGAAMALAAGLFVWLAMQQNIESTDLAFDWKIVYRGIANGQVRWGDTMRVPPWAVIFLLPLGYLPASAGWGLIIFLTIAALVLSVPRNIRGRYFWPLLAVLLLSHPALRNYVDGNLEAFTVLGVLLLIFSCEKRKPILLGLSVLIATIKPQSTYLLILIMAIYLFQIEAPRFYLKAAAATLVVLIPTLVWGAERWLFAVQDQLPQGISAVGALRRASAPPLLILVVGLVIAGITVGIAYRGNRRLSQLKVGLLMAGSALASPYTNALTLLTVMAIGIIPLVIRRPKLGIPLLLLYNVPFLFLADPLWVHEVVLPTTLFISWIVLAWQVYQAEVVKTSFTPVSTQSVSQSIPGEAHVNQAD
jgi:hypothetical protein